MMVGASSGPSVIDKRSLSYPADLAERLTRRRDLLGLKDSRVAKRAGLATSTVSRTMRGLRRPSIVHIARYARALLVSVDELVAPTEGVRYGHEALEEAPPDAGAGHV